MKYADGIITPMIITNHQLCYTTHINNSPMKKLLTHQFFFVA
jgi:hypothetical protein